MMKHYKSIILTVLFAAAVMLPTVIGLDVQAADSFAEEVLYPADDDSEEVFLEETSAGSALEDEESPDNMLAELSVSAEENVGQPEENDIFENGPAVSADVLQEEPDETEIIYEAEESAQADHEEAIIKAADGSRFQVVTDLSNTYFDIKEGESVELSIRVITYSGKPVKYEWKKDGSVIEGEESSSYTATDGGDYTARAYDDNGNSGTIEFSVYATKNLGAKLTVESDDPTTGVITVNP